MISRLRALRDLLRQPLFRLLAINLAIGVSAAALMLGGLLLLNPHGLRDLIVADRSPLVAAGLLLFGLVVTFGSVAMGAAIMTLGRDDGRGGKMKSAPVCAAAAMRSSPLIAGGRRRPRRTFFSERRLQATLHAAAERARASAAPKMRTLPLATSLKCGGSGVIS